MLATWVWCPSAPPPAPCPPPQPLPAAFSLHKPIIYCCNKTDQSDSLKGHLSWRGHLHHLTFVEEAAHLAHSLICVSKEQSIGWVTSVEKSKSLGLIAHRDNASCSPCCKHLKQLPPPGKCFIGVYRFSYHLIMSRMSAMGSSLSTTWRWWCGILPSSITLARVTCRSSVSLRIGGF